MTSCRVAAQKVFGQWRIALMPSPKREDRVARSRLAMNDGQSWGGGRTFNLT